MTARKIRVTREDFRERAALDTAVSRGAAAAGCVGHGAGDAAGVHAGGCGGVRAAGYARGGVWQGDCCCSGTGIRGDRAACGRAGCGVSRRDDCVLVDDAGRDAEG